MRTLKLLTLALIAANVATALPQRGRFAMVKVAATDAETRFIFTIETAGADTFTLPLRTGNAYNFIVDWGDGGSSEITAFDDPDITHSYTGAGTYTLAIDGTCEAWYFNNAGDALLLRTVENLGTVGWTSLLSAFYGCGNMTSFVCGNNDTSGVGVFYSMFRGCNTMSTLDISCFDTSSATRFDYMFYDCDDLTEIDVSHFDASGVTTTDFMFRLCSSLTTVPNLPITSSTLLTNVRYMYGTIGAGMGGTVTEYWNATNFPNISAFDNFATGDTGLDNYDDIPDSWKGL